MIAGENTVIVKVNKNQRELTEKEGVLFLPTFMKPLAHYTQSGEVVEFGSGIKDIQKGDQLLFHHSVQPDLDRLIDFDLLTGDEYWIVREEYVNKEIYGYIRGNDIFPYHNYIVSKGTSVDTSKHFKTIVLNKPLFENRVEIGDILLFRSHANYVIKINQEPYWFCDLKYCAGRLGISESVKILEKIKVTDEQTRKKMDWVTIS